MHTYLNQHYTYHYTYHYIIPLVGLLHSKSVVKSLVAICDFGKPTNYVCTYVVAFREIPF